MILLLLLSVGLTGWILARLDDEETKRSSRKIFGPDSYMEDFVQTTMDENGQLETRLRAPRMVHFPADGSTVLTKPRLDVYNARGRPWHASAERAWVSGDKDLILLFGKVQLWRQDGSGKREWNLLTSEVRVLPEQEYAETTSPVTVIGKNTVTRSLGMKADLLRDRLQLTRKVRSRHEVKPGS